MGAEKQKDPRVLAMEFILADAEGNTEKAQAVLNYVIVEDETVVPFIVALARMTAEVLQNAVGDDWTSQMNVAILSLEVAETIGDLDE